MRRHALHALHANQCLAALPSFKKHFRGVVFASTVITLVAILSVQHQPKATSLSIGHVPIPVSSWLPPPQVRRCASLEAAISPTASSSPH